MLALWLLPLTASAQSADGLWRTFNDRSGLAEGIVQMATVGNELRGTVQKVFSPPAPTRNPLCEECRGELKNQPIVGMTIVSGLKWNGEEYTGGHILDPDSGAVYRCTVRVIENGRKLEVRGYIGVPLLGRTQIWLRESAGPQ